MGENSHIDPAAPAKGWRYRISFGSLVVLLNSIGTGWIFVLLILINADIIGRSLFNKPVRGVTEIVGMTIVAYVFLQLSHAIKVGRLTRSDIILSRLRDSPSLSVRSKPFTTFWAPCFWPLYPFTASQFSLTLGPSVNTREHRATLWRRFGL